MEQLVVQHVGILWTKASRCAPAATRRNALPRAWPLPQSPALHLLHEVRYREREHDFETTTTTRAALFMARAPDDVCDLRADLF